MRALEYALSYGIKSRTGCRVEGFGGNLKIKGEKFDHVIVATEAAAIKYILAPKLKGLAEVFDKVKYVGRANA